MGENGNLNVKYRAKSQECYVSVNGVVYRLHCKIKEKDIFELHFDDKCIVSKKYWLVKLKGFDYAIKIGEETIHCVFDEENLDIAIHGKYLKSQKNYIPLKSVYIICMISFILVPIILAMVVLDVIHMATLSLSIGMIGSVGIYYKKSIR